MGSKGFAGLNRGTREIRGLPGQEPAEAGEADATGWPGAAGRGNFNRR